MEDQLKNDFDKIIKDLKLTEKNIKLRKKILKNFIKYGFPNKRSEDWKFSDLKKIINSNIEKLSFFNLNTIFKEEDSSIYINNFQHNKIVFVNGLIFKIDFNYEEKDKIEIIEDLNLDRSINKNNALISLNDAFISNYIKFN